MFNDGQRKAFPSACWAHSKIKKLLECDKHVVVKLQKKREITIRNCPFEAHLYLGFDSRGQVVVKAAGSLKVKKTIVHLGLNALSKAPNLRMLFLFLHLPEADEMIIR